MLDPRVQELLDWMAMTGLELPYTIEEILALEDQGHVVDLITGEIHYDAADTERFSLTILGEAELIADRELGEDDEE